VKEVRRPVRQGAVTVEVVELAGRLLTVYRNQGRLYVAVFGKVSTTGRRLENLEESCRVTWVWPMWRGPSEGWGRVEVFGSFAFVNGLFIERQSTKCFAEPLAQRQYNTDIFKKIKLNTFVVVQFLFF
jgi:hypothetical protein